MTLGRIRKALTPFVIGIVSPVISWVATGHLDLVTERLAVAGALTGLLVYFVPNDEPLPPPLPVVTPVVPVEPAPVISAPSASLSETY